MLVTNKISHSNSWLFQCDPEEPKDTYPVPIPKIKDSGID